MSDGRRDAQGQTKQGLYDALQKAQSQCGEYWLQLEDLRAELRECRAELELTRQDHAETELARQVAASELAEMTEKSQRGTDLACAQELRALKAEKERDTARAECTRLEAYAAQCHDESSRWAEDVHRACSAQQVLQEQLDALQAKVARAVAELQDHALPLLSEDGAAEHAVMRALEALR